MGRAHSRTSACVSAQHALPDRADPTTWTWFTSCLLRRWSAPTSNSGENLLTTFPDASWHPWSSWSDSRHCQKQHARPVPIAAILLKKTKKRFFGRETLFSLVRPPSSRPLRRWGGGAIRSRRWGDLPQGVGQIAPPPSGGSFWEDEPERGPGWGAQATAASGFTEPGATLPAQPGRGFRRSLRRDRRGRSSTAAQTGAVH